MEIKIKDLLTFFTKFIRLLFNKSAATGNIVYDILIKATANDDS